MSAAFKLPTKVAAPAFVILKSLRAVLAPTLPVAEKLPALPAFRVRLPGPFTV